MTLKIVIAKKHRGEDVELYQKLRDDFENSEFWRFIGFKFVSCEYGKAKVKFRHRNEFHNVKGTMHGGIYMSALDTVMGLASMSLGLDKIVTIQMETRFLKSVTRGELFATGQVIHQTNSIVIAEGRLFDESDSLVGYSTGTFKVSN
jgi:acyl-CoA thioesterase